MTTAADCAMRECSACHQGVPTGPFCGRCGADQRTSATQIRKLLRPNAFIAAHRQPVFLPLITSTLCPHLAGPDRIVFRHGLILAAGGIPSVVFGPGAIAQAHTADEWVALRSLERATRLLVSFLHTLS